MGKMCPDNRSRLSALPFPVDPGQMDHTLALNEPDHLRDRIFWGNRDHHVDVIRHEMAFFDSTFLLHGQLAEDLSEMLSQFPIKRLSAALGNEHHMVFALPLRVA